MTAPLLSFVVEGVPRPRERARRDPRSGRWFTPKRTREYQERVGWAALRAAARGSLAVHGPVHITGPVRVNLRIYFPDRRIRDKDGVESNVLDALKKAGVIADDRWTLVPGGRQECALDRERPRIEVDIWRAEG